MKLWRKLAKKEPSGDWTAVTDITTGAVVGKDPIMKRNGRQLAYQLRMGEQYSKMQPKTTDFLDALFQRAGIKFVMTKKEEAKLKEMVESVNQKQEDTNETI